MVNEGPAPSHRPSVEGTASADGGLGKPSPWSEPNKATIALPEMLPPLSRTYDKIRDRSFLSRNSCAPRRRSSRADPTRRSFGRWEQSLPLGMPEVFARLPHVESAKSVNSLRHAMKNDSRRWRAAGEKTRISTTSSYARATRPGSQSAHRLPWLDLLAVGASRNR